MKEWHADTLAVVDALMAAGDSLSAVNAAGTTPLHWSVHSDSDRLITGLLDRLCPQLAAARSQPPTPSAQPHSAPQLPTCSALLARNERNETALHWAVDWQKAVAVSALLRLADDSRGSGTAEASKGRTTAARELVAVADVNGDTPLHRLPVDCPSSASCRLIAQLLIASGANVTAENRAHRTPLAHFPTPTPTQDEQSGGPVTLQASQSDGLDAQAERFRRNLSQHFNTVQ